MTSISDEEKAVNDTAAWPLTEVVEIVQIGGGSLRSSSSATPGIKLASLPFPAAVSPPLLQMRYRSRPLLQTAVRNLHTRVSVNTSHSLEAYLLCAQPQLTGLPTPDAYCCIASSIEFLLLFLLKSCAGCLGDCLHLLAHV